MEGREKNIFLKVPRNVWREKLINMFKKSRIPDELLYVDRYKRRTGRKLSMLVRAVAVKLEQLQKSGKITEARSCFRGVLESLCCLSEHLSELQ